MRILEGEFHHGDHVRVDVTGGAVEYATPIKYDVWGSERGGPSGAEHKFVGALGHPSDSATGLIYMRARYMDPALGRFISEDPARDGANWYVYCRNNPVNLVDGDGRAAGPVAVFLVLATAFAATYAGYWVGYAFALTDIQSMDPKYKPSLDPVGGLVVSAAQTALTSVITRVGPAWGRGIGIGALAPRLGLVGAIGFIVGSLVGTRAAYLEYASFLTTMENYD